MFTELSGDQIRIQTNAAQAFDAWREADLEFRHSYKGRMNWSKVNGRQYLYRIVGKSRKSLGVRSPETQKIKEEYTSQRTRLRERRRRLSKKLDELRQIHQAYRLGRVPNIAARVLEALDQRGLLGEHLLVTGTHSLFAFEAAAGVHFEDGLIATTDIDFMWDARRKLKLALLDVPENGVIGVLKSVDPSFARSKRHYRAVNDDGYFVDLIRPMEANKVISKLKGLGNQLDLEAAAILGLQWLINAPRFEQTVIAENGQPLRLCCIDPRAFALYKRWLAKDAPNRDAAKRTRDSRQAIAAAHVSEKRLGLRFRPRDLAALPLRLTQHAKELVTAS